MFELKINVYVSDLGLAVQNLLDLLVFTVSTVAVITVAMVTVTGDAVRLDIDSVNQSTGK